MTFPITPSTGLAAAGFAGLFLLAARRPWSLLYQILPPLAAWGAATGAAAVAPAWFAPLSGGTAALFLVTAEYGLHLLAVPARAAARAARLPVWMGALAAAGSVLAFMVWRTPESLRVAAALAFGFLAAGACAAWLLPYFSSATELAPPRLDFNSVTARLEVWAAAHPRATLIAAGAVWLAAGAGLVGVSGTGKLFLMAVLAPALAAGGLVFLATLRWEWALAAAVAPGTVLAAVWGIQAGFGPGADSGAFIPVLAVQGTVIALGRSLAAFRGRQSSSGSALLTAVELGLAAWVLSAAGNPAWRGLGPVLALTAAAALAAEVWLAPALARRVLPADSAQTARVPASVPDAVKSRYAFLGARVEQYIFWKTLLDPVYALAAARLPASGLILDLGCGYGLMSHWAARSAPGRRLWGIDLDSRKLAVAERTARYDPRLTFLRGDLLQADLPSARAALLLDILHYSRPEVQVRMLRRAAAALEPGGGLVVCETCLRPGQFSWAAFWDGFSMRIGFNPRSGGMNLTDVAGWEARFAAAGLRVEVSDSCGKSRRLFALKPVPAP